MTFDSTFLFKTASSSRDPYPEDETTRVPDNEVLRGPANLRVVIVPKGYKRTPTARPTPREFLAYCNNGRKELNEYALPVAYYQGLWYRIVPQTTGFYRKEPRTSVSTFNTYDLEEVLQEVKEPSPIEKEFPPFNEPKEEASNHSDDSDNEEQNENDVQIRNSPIVIAPPPYTFLPPITMASTSTSTQVQVAAQGSPPGSPVQNSSTPNQIAAIFRQCFGPPSGGGGGGGSGGGGGPPPQQQQPQQQQNVPPAPGVRTMGKLPEIFDGDTVGQKTVPMFGCFAKIGLEQIKKNSE